MSVSDFKVLKHKNKTKKMQFFLSAGPPPQKLCVMRRSRMSAWVHCDFLFILFFFVLLSVQSRQTMCSGIQEAAAIGCEMKIGRLQQ